MTCRQGSVAPAVPPGRAVASGRAVAKCLLAKRLLGAGLAAALLVVGGPSQARAVAFGPASVPGATGAQARPDTVVLYEGTNVAAALSPDGGTLALDLLGRIWTMPVAGGRAEPLTDPFGDARQPAWSPDGRRIAFHAYWDGNYHIWSVAADGSDLRRHTTGPFDHREPHWAPDGRRIAFSSDRGGSYDLWSATVSGGQLEQLTDAPDSEYGPAFSPDGARLAFASDGADDVAGIWVLEADGSSGRIAGAEGAQVAAPAWRVDGATLSYNAIAGDRSVLRTADAGRSATASATTGGSGPVLTGDDEDVFPFRASWTESGFFYTADGKVRWRDPEGGGLRDAPFTARVALHGEPYRRRPRDLTAPGPFPVLGVVSPAVSPDGRRVAFSALGDLWLHTIGGATERLTDDPWVETDPAWSPDGGSLAFVSDRGGVMELWRWRGASGAQGDGAFEQLTDGVAPRVPTWSPDGDRIAFVGSGYQTGVGVVDVASGAVRELRSGLNGAGRPTWFPEGGAIAVSAHVPYSARFREGVNQVLVLPAPRGPAAFAGQVGQRFLEFPAHASIGSRGTDGPVRSPDGAWTAYVSAGVLWAVATGRDGNPAGPPRRLVDGPAEDPTWTGDSRSIVYLAGAALRRVDLLDGRVHDIPLGLQWERAEPPGRVLVRAGALLDGRSWSLSRDVDVVLEGGAIAEVAPRDPSRTAPTVVDASDGVVMPGFVEMHAHVGIGDGEAAGRLWLSFGVTSVRCPACDPYEIAEAREAGESGKRVAPRWFGTSGTIDGSRIYYPGAPALGAPAQVALEMERAEALGYDMIKTYVRLSDPMQRRVIEDAHAIGLPVSSHELYPAVAYGGDGVEHVRGTSRRGYSTKVSELQRSYQDVVALLAASGMTLTPTVGIYGAYPLLASEDPSLLDDPRVEAFFPWASQAARARAPADPALARRLAEAMAALPRRVVAAGGRVVMGTDAPINPSGVSYHAEMEALVRYGQMSPADALRAATSEAAAALGYEGRLGVVAPGALADLVVLDADPLEDIRATRRVRTVIAGGRVHQVASLLQRPR